MMHSRQDTHRPGLSPAGSSAGRSLKLRFIFFVTLLTFITMSLVAVFSINRERRIIIENVLRKSDLAAHTIARVSSELSPDEIARVRDLCSIMTADSDIAAVFIKRRAAGFFEASRTDETLLTVSSEAGPVAAPSIPEREDAILFKDIFQMKYYFHLGDSFNLFTTFRFRDNSYGEVWIEARLASTKREIDAMLWQHFILTALVTFFGGLISVLLAQVVLTPLNLLLKSTRDISAGIYGQRLPITGSDEVSRLSTAFNEMLDHLEQKEELERRMQNLDKLVTVGQLAAGIAHEIKNPLTSVRSLAELLRDEKGLCDDSRKAIEIIISEVERLTRVTNEFTGLARPKVSRKYSFFDVNGVIRNTIMLLGPQLRKNSISVFTNLNSRMLVHGDPDELAQVFVNVTINSMQALEKKEKNRNIIINTTDADDACRVDIIDNGCGIPAENVDRIFMPFFTDKKGGTGLGLSIVKRILDDMNAGVSVESEAGAGTAFRITIPIKTDYSKSPAPESETERAAAPAATEAS